MKVGHSLIQRTQRGRGRGDLIQRIFTQTKSITDHEHEHIHKPEAVTVTCTPEAIHQILCRPNITQDQDPNHQYVHGRKTVTNVLTCPQKKHVRLHDPDHNYVHDREKLTNIDTLPQRNIVRHHNQDPVLFTAEKNSQTLTQFPRAI